MNDHYDDRSYYGIVPSETLCENDYENYLKHADPYELEHDILSYETLLKISEEMNEDAKEKIRNIINTNAWNRYYKRISKK
jgi:hypothetical protein